MNTKQTDITDNKHARNEKRKPRFNLQTTLLKRIRRKLICLNVREVGHPTTREVGHSTTKEVGHPTTREVGHPTTKEVGHPTTKEVGHPTTKEVGHSTTKEVGHPTTKEVGHPTTNICQTSKEQGKKRFSVHFQKVIPQSIENNQSFETGSLC